MRSGMIMTMACQRRRNGKRPPHIEGVGQKSREMRERTTLGDQVKAMIMITLEAVTMKTAEVEQTVEVMKTRIARTATRVPVMIGLTEVIGMIGTIGTIEIRRKVHLKGKHRMRGWHVNNERD